MSITRLLIMGDSLSDPGNLKQRKIAGFLRLSELSGLDAKSNTGQFTNGDAWAGDLWSILEQRYKQQKFFPNPSDGSCVAGPVQPRTGYQAASSLPDYPADEQMTRVYAGACALRNYSEGGATAWDFFGAPSWNPKLFFSRLLLGTLDAKRRSILEDDLKYSITHQQKQETLVIEWSGANDAMTVNAEFTEEIADKIVEARVRNIEILMGLHQDIYRRRGLYGQDKLTPTDLQYKNFCLFNMPDISLTPRYQLQALKVVRAEAKKSSVELTPEREKGAIDLHLQKVRKMCEYVNAELKKRCDALKKAYEVLGCSIKIFDVYKAFQEAYAQPQQYGFKADLLRTPYVESVGFVNDAEHNTAPGAENYMFWDDVHPTAAMHRVLANKFLEQFKDSYTFTAPVVEKEVEESDDELQKEINLVMQFQAAYVEKYRKEAEGRFGFWRRSRLEVALFDPRATLRSALAHALHGGGKRTRAVFEELGWLTKDGQLTDAAPQVLGEIKTALDKAEDPRLFDPSTPEARRNVGLR